MRGTTAHKPRVSMHAWMSLAAEKAEGGQLGEGRGMLQSSRVLCLYEHFQ